MSYKINDRELELTVISMMHASATALSRVAIEDFFRPPENKENEQKFAGTAAEHFKKESFRIVDDILAAGNGIFYSPALRQQTVLTRIAFYVRLASRLTAEGDLFSADIVSSALGHMAIYRLYHGDGEVNGLKLKDEQAEQQLENSATSQGYARATNLYIPKLKNTHAIDNPLSYTTLITAAVSQCQIILNKNNIVRDLQEIYKMVGEICQAILGLQQASNYMDFSLQLDDFMQLFEDLDIDVKQLKQQQEMISTISTSRQNVLPIINQWIMNNLKLLGLDVLCQVFLENYRNAQIILSEEHPVTFCNSRLVDHRKDVVDLSEDERLVKSKSIRTPNVELADDVSKALALSNTREVLRNVISRGGAFNAKVARQPVYNGYGRTTRVILPGKPTHFAQRHQATIAGLVVDIAASISYGVMFGFSIMTAGIGLVIAATVLALANALDSYRARSRTTVVNIAAPTPENVGLIQDSSRSATRSPVVTTRGRSNSSSSALSTDSSSTPRSDTSISRTRPHR